ncbi:hypothetical protein NE865_04421 [Phthorimaea operculella]|nr:hypothetical protein NE865_04421 [Phthorimaea operculella]
MARHRRTLALIIICLPILATVITAFRVRDLPKNLQDSFRSDVKKQKCDDCDVSDAKDRHSVKIESATRNGGIFGGLKKLAQQLTGAQDDFDDEKPSKKKEDKKEKDSPKTDKKDKIEDKEKKQDKVQVKKQPAVKKETVPIVKKEVEKKPVEKPKTLKEEVKKPKEPVPAAKPKEQKDTKSKPETKPKADSKEKDEKPQIDKKKEVKKPKSSSEEMLVDSKEIYSLDKDGKMVHVTDALRRKNMLQNEFEDFYAFFPTFAPNFSRIHNPECRRHGQIMLRQLRGTKLWALNMLDATAKIPSGILQGNTIQLGDFDQCLMSRAKVQLDTGSVVKVEGQYCLARLEVKAEDPELEVPLHLALAKNLVKSRIDDPGHFVPRFSTLSWGVCVPAVCAPQDVEVVIKDAINHYQHRSGFVVRVKVDEEDCHTQDIDWWEDWMELPTILTLSFYAVILLLVLIATLQDYLARRGSSGEDSQKEEGEEQEAKDGEEKEEKEEGTESKPSDGFLPSFSLYRTIRKLIAPGTDDEISCIHGVRGIATIALLVAHKFLPVAVMPFTNRLKITELASSPMWSWVRQGWMFTDCFLLLSGTLTAHRISSDSTAAWRLFTRFLRLTPALLAVVLFYAYVWDLISAGPMWGTLVSKNAEICQESWWWNLLYVQNYFGFEEMCAPQTHQLAIDMQLTILGGILVWALSTQHVATRFLLPSLHIIAAYSRYTTVKEHRLTLIAYYGVSVSQLYRTARLSYTSILHRSTPYLVGLSLGLALRKPAEHGKLVLLVGWLTSIALWSSVWYAGYDSGYTTYKYSSTFSAQYSAFAPIANALAIGWFIVFLTTAATVRTSQQFTLISLLDVQEASIILLSSVILTLTFVTPMQSLPKLFSFSSKAGTEEENKEEEKEQAGGEEPEEGKETEENHIEEVTEVPQRSRGSFLAHREVLEEIPEVEVEYETQRDKDDVLEEILEEEEDGEEIPNHIDDEDLEIIEEEGEGDIDAEGRKIVFMKEKVVS